MNDSAEAFATDPGTGEKILLWAQGDRDRSLLTETLEAEGYACVSGAEHLADPDLGLLIADAETAACHRDRIQKRLTRNEELFLPFLVLTTGSPRELGRPVREIADELVPMPSTKYEITLRVRQLLRARSYSREAARQRDRIAAQEENYRLLAESAVDGILVYRDGAIRYANEAAAELFGAEDGEDLQGRSLYDLVVGLGERRLPTDTGEVEEASDPKISFETEFAGLDGRCFYGRWRVGSTQFDGEEAVQMAIRDVTRKKERKERLRLLAEAVGQVGDKIMITDAEGRIQYVNAAFEKLTGYAEEEVLGKDPRILNSGQQDEAFHKRMWEALENGEDFRAEFVNERKDGTTYIEDQTISPVRDEDGTITHYVSTGRNITEQKRREEELRESKRLFERVAEESPVSIVIAREETYLYVNSAFEELSGYGKDELVENLGPSDLVHPDRKDDMDADFARMGQGGETRTQDETILMRQNGEARPIRVYRSLVQFEGREAVLAVLVDISEEVRQREAREEARREIEQASQMKSALLQNMSHEIRTPLASIIGFADLLEGQLREAGSETEFAELIQHSGERLLGTLDNILRLAELESEETELQVEETGVTDLLEEVLEPIRIRAAEKDLALQVEVPEEAVPARIDPGAIKQILSNLIDNALKFTREGRVEVTLTADEEKLTFQIIDTGIGIEKSKIDQLLEPFRQRSVGLAREYEGTGLGLTIAQKLTDRAGGQLEIKSEPEEGTTITASLPRWAGEEPRGPERQWGLESLPADQTILAVDDDPSLLELLAEMLPETYEIDTVTTPEEALERAETGRYDLIFLDINLKDELDGTDLLRRMRSMDAANRALIIAITAYAMAGDGDRFREQGFDGYVPKPFTYETLRENLIQVFG